METMKGTTSSKRKKAKKRKSKKAGLADADCITLKLQLTEIPDVNNRPLLVRFPTGVPYALKQKRRKTSESSSVVDPNEEDLMNGPLEVDAKSGELVLVRSREPRHKGKYLLCEDKETGILHYGRLGQSQSQFAKTTTTAANGSLHLAVGVIEGVGDSSGGSTQPCHLLPIADCTEMQFAQHFAESRFVSHSQMDAMEAATASQHIAADSDSDSNSDSDSQSDADSSENLADSAPIDSSKMSLSELKSYIATQSKEKTKTKSHSAENSRMDATVNTFGSKFALVSWRKANHLAKVKAATLASMKGSDATSVARIKHIEEVKEESDEDSDSDFEPVKEVLAMRKEADGSDAVESVKDDDESDDSESDDDSDSDNSSESDSESEAPQIESLFDSVPKGKSELCILAFVQNKSSEKRSQVYDVNTIVPAQVWAAIEDWDAAYAIVEKWRDAKQTSSIFGARAFSLSKMAKRMNALEKTDELNESALETVFSTLLTKAIGRLLCYEACHALLSAARSRWAVNAKRPAFVSPELWLALLSFAKEANGAITGTRVRMRLCSLMCLLALSVSNWQLTRQSVSSLLAADLALPVTATNVLLQIIGCTQVLESGADISHLSAKEVANGAHTVYRLTLPISPLQSLKINASHLKGDWW